LPFVLINLSIPRQPLTAISGFSSNGYHQNLKNLCFCFLICELLISFVNFTYYSLYFSLNKENLV
jgi:hypothetical protein